MYVCCIQCSVDYVHVVSGSGFTADFLASQLIRKREHLQHNTAVLIMTFMYTHAHMWSSIVVHVIPIRHCTASSEGGH